MIDEPFTEFIREIFSKERDVGLTDLLAYIVSNIGIIVRNTFITPATAIS